MKFPTNTLAIANLYGLLSAINASVAPIVISLGGLAGAYLLDDDKSLATLPVSGFNVGVALMAGPASLFMYRIGRQRGFMAGSLLGLPGSFWQVSPLSSTALSGYVSAFCLPEAPIVSSSNIDSQPQIMWTPR